MQKVFPNVRIEHVGSTSVLGLGGKKIIDIAIRPPESKVSQFIKVLEKLGYKFTKEHPKNSKRIFIKKTIKYAGKERQIHVHLVLNKKYWDSFIVFRDYLRKHDKERDAYAKIKKEGAKIARGDAERYKKYKKAFLEKIMKLALRE